MLPGTVIYHNLDREIITVIRVLTDNNCSIWDIQIPVYLISRTTRYLGTVTDWLQKILSLIHPCFFFISSLSEYELNMNRNLEQASLKKTKNINSSFQTILNTGMPINTSLRTMSVCSYDSVPLFYRRPCPSWAPPFSWERQSWPSCPSWVRRCLQHCLLQYLD
jgi:hypothetical protein